VLVLGCHRGDEIAALADLDDPPRDLEVVGVDHAPGPLAEAQARFPHGRFVLSDVARLPDDVGRFDLIVAVAVLQSPAVDDRALLRQLVQTRLTEGGGLLLGLPNGRFRGDDPVWGARTRNFAEPDLSLVVNDLAVYRRYLHQHGFRTHVGGRYDLLLTAWRGARAAVDANVAPD
ncbi:MAG: class I SAM-dependent methyltransferase, partial [bacterium]|nr:class I SAM-dependent methyltransferase [bacterium]